jgi:hypothetical protein
MKNKIRTTVIIFLLTSFFLGFTIPDGGDCARFYGKFKLANGEIIEGFVDSGRLDFENAKKDFKRFLSHTEFDIKLFDSIMIYNTVDTLKSIGIKRMESCDRYFFACPKERTKIIAFEDMKEATMIKVFPCETCNQKEYPYASGGYFPGILTELNPSEIAKLKSEKPVNRLNMELDQLTTIYLINYNSVLSTVQIEKLYVDFSKKSDYETIKEEFRKRNIILFTIYSIP